MTKIGSILGHRVDYNGVEALRGSGTYPAKINPSTPLPPAPVIRQASFKSYLPSKKIYLSRRDYRTELCPSPTEFAKKDLTFLKWILKKIDSSPGSCVCRQWAHSHSLLTIAYPKIKHWMSWNKIIKLFNNYIRKKVKTILAYLFTSCFPPDQSPKFSIS